MMISFKCCNLEVYFLFLHLFSASEGICSNMRIYWFIFDISFPTCARGFMAVMFVEESYNIQSMHYSCSDIFCQTNFWRNIFSSYENSWYIFHAYLITQHQDSSIVRFFTLVKWLLSKFTLKSRFRSCTVYFGHGYFQVLMKKIYLCICTFFI